MRKQVSFFVSIMLFVTTAFSQSIQDIMNNENLNYFEKIALIEQDSSNLKDGVEQSVLKRYDRWRSFWDTRAGTDGSETAYAAAWHEIFNGTSLPSGGTGETWEFVGPIENENMKREMGRVMCLTSDPTNTNIIYAGAETGGLWKTTNPLDAYPHWECLTDDYAGMGVTDVVVHPTNSNTIFMVTGIHVNGMMKKNGSYSLGAYKSTDAGENWDLMMNLVPDSLIYLTKLMLDPNNSNIMYILSTETVYKSTDGGNQWNDMEVNPIGDVSFRSIVINPLNTNDIYISGTDAIYKSSNAGTSWSKITTLGHPAKSNITIAWHPIENCIYALYGNGGAGFLKKSYNQGSSWFQINSVVYIYDYINALSISPNGNIYAGGMFILKSEDLGVSFDLQTTMHADIRGFLYPNTINDSLTYIATDGGVVRNSTGADNGWVSCNGDLCVNQFYDIAISEQDPDLILGGSHDCGTMKRKTDGSWERYSFGGDGGTSKISKHNKNLQFATINGDLNRSTDGGMSFVEIEIDFEDYDGSFCFDPNNSNIIYTTTSTGQNAYSLLKSTNSGAEGSFNPITGNVGVIFDIEVSKANSNYIYFSNFHWWDEDETFFYKSNDAGANWTTNDFSDTHAPIRDIATHPEDPNKVWIVFGGLNEDYKVMYTATGGLFWLNKTYNLPNMPVNKILYDDINERIIIATDIGVYYRNDGGIYWHRMGSGLPNMLVTDLELNRSTGDLYIGTFGRGIWKLHMDEYCYSNAELSITGNAYVCNSNNINYTLENLPSGCTVQWTTSSNFEEVSGQGTDIYTIRSTGNSVVSQDWVKAQVISSICEDRIIQKDVYISDLSELAIEVPSEPINGEFDAMVWASGLPSSITSYSWTASYGTIVSQEANSATISFPFCNKKIPLILEVQASGSCGTNTVSRTVSMFCDDRIVNPLSVTPNPSDNYIEILLSDLDESEFVDGEKIHIKLYDSRSIPVYNGVSQQKQFQINTSEFDEGLYFVRIQYKNKKYTTTILITHQ
jgi:photosystem II stability/assembly factor-like uncharacterized protein